MSATDEDDEIDDFKQSSKSLRKSLKSSDDEDSLSSDESESSNQKSNGNKTNDAENAETKDGISLETGIGNILRLQKQLQSLQKQLDKEKSNKATLENKRTSLEADNKLLNQKIDGVMKEKRSVEQLKIELETKLRTLQMELKEENARREMAEMKANKLKEQITRSEEHCKAETAAKQKSDMLIRTLQIQLQNANGMLKQLETEKDELDKKMLENKSALIIAQSPRRREDSLSQIALEREKANSREKIQLLSKENKRLQDSLNDLKRDLKTDEDTLEQSTIHHSLEMGQLKTENLKLKGLVEDIERVKSELQSAKDDLSKKVSDLEKLEKEKAEREKLLNDETNKMKNLLEQRDSEITKANEDCESLTKKLMDIEVKQKKAETELKSVNRDLNDKVRRLSEAQNELEKHDSLQNSLERNASNDKEENFKLQVKAESLQEKVNKLQEEDKKIRQNLEDERQKLKQLEDVHEVVIKKSKDQDKALQEIQTKNDRLTEKAEDVADKLELSEWRKISLEKDLETLQNKFDDVQQRILSNKMALDADDRLKGDLQSERDQLVKKVERLNKELEETKKTQSTLQNKISELMSEKEKADNDIIEYNQALKKKQEELHLAMRQLEENNAKLKDVVTEEQMPGDQKSSMQQTSSKPNITDFDKSSSRHWNPSDHHSDVMYSSDDTLLGKNGRRQKKLDSNKNSAVEKEVGKLKAQLRMAKKQLKAMESGTYPGGRHQSGFPSWQQNGLDPMEQQLLQHSRHLANKLKDLQRLERTNRELGSNTSKTDGNLDQLTAEMEARIRMDLNKKLAAINEYLQEHAETCEKIDAMRDNSAKVIRNDFDNTETKLQEELNRLREAQNFATSLRQTKEHDQDQESLKVKDLYSSTTAKPSSNALLANQRAANVNFRPTAIANSFPSAVDSMLISPNQSTTPQRSNGLPWSVRNSLSGLPLNIKKQLDRSIAKHLEKAPQLNITPVHRTESGFTSAAMFDRTTHEYGSVLKRNYLIR